MEFVCEKDQTKVEDMVRLLCLLMFQSIFFANTGQTFAWGFLYFVDDFKRLNSYDWSKHIISEVNRGLEAEWDDPTQVNGCTLLLQYWFCEHCGQTCDMYEEKMKAQGKRSESNSLIQIPRITKWEASDLVEAFEKALAKDDVTLSFNGKRLIPTPAEEELILSLKDMNEVDELSDNELDHQPEETLPETENERESTEKEQELTSEPDIELVEGSLMRSQLEEKNKKIAELEQELVRMQKLLDAERTEEAVAKMDLVSKLKQLEEENNQLHDVLGRLAEQHDIIEPDYNVFCFAEVV